MSTVLHAFRGPNLAVTLVVLAVVVLFLVLEYAYDWPFPLHHDAR